jgi:hypothetical protein
MQIHQTKEITETLREWSLGPKTYFKSIEKKQN